jgi:UDP-glucose 4-epimerase
MEGKAGDLFVQKAPAASVETIVEALRLLIGVKKVDIETIGVRPGEKIHETLLTAEEKFRSKEHKKYFQVPNVGSLDSKSSNMQNIDNVEYSSDNTEQLSAEALAELLASIPLIRDLMKKD